MCETEGPSRKQLKNMIDENDHCYRFLSMMLCVMEQAQVDGASVALPAKADDPMIYIEYDRDKMDFLNSWVGKDPDT